MSKRSLFLILIFPFLAHAETPTEGDFNKMGCTQAVAFVASQITEQQPPGTLPKVWKKGQVETLAIQYLNRVSGPPCHSNYLPKINGFGAKPQSEKR